MHKARAFFFVCAGLFLLALTYHLGAIEAQGQATTIDGAKVADHWVSGAVGRTFHFSYGGGNCYPREHGVVPTPIPGTSRVVDTAAGGASCGFGFYRALLDNGDFYGSDGDSWQYLGNLQDGPTPAQQESWGAMKSRYRGQREPAPTGR